jgi:hypothetical protein
MTKERAVRSATPAQSSNFAELLRKGRETYDAGEQYENSSFDKVPAGTYIARLNLAEFRLSKNGNLMVTREHIVIEGEFKGKMIVDNMMYGSSEFGTGKIRQYVKTVTGEACPADPADLEPLIGSFASKYAYDCKLKVAYSGEGEDGFTNVTVVECYEVDNTVSTDGAEVKPVASKKEEVQAEDTVLKTKLTNFIGRQDLAKEMKGKKRSTDVIEDMELEIADWTYDEDDLNDEEKELLAELGLEDCIEKKAPPVQSPKREKR